MELKYVGARPTVSQHGINFDQTKPDKYTYLGAAIELLDALDFKDNGDKSLHLYHVDHKEYNSRQLLEALKKYCKNIDEIFETREEKTNAIIQEYRNKVKENERLTSDERSAWLGNIDIMRDYYLQYITNESAYNCILQALADRIHQANIEEITFSIGRNYGLVMGHLLEVLKNHKPPYDASLDFIEKDATVLGKLDLNRPEPHLI
jgi:hypothetical protein